MGKKNCEMDSVSSQGPTVPVLQKKKDTWVVKFSRAQLAELDRDLAQFSSPRFLGTKWQEELYRLQMLPDERQIVKMRGQTKKQQKG